MKKKLTNNIGLKILALLVSVVLWLIVVNINDPITSTTFSGIPVEVTNESAITGQGKVYAVLEDTNQITVTVTAKRSIVDALSRDNIRAIADMEELTFMDTVGIKLSSNKYNDKIESIVSSTESLKVQIEDMKKTQLAIEATTTGEPEEGYILGSVTTDQNVVRLSGPESVISTIDKVVANVDVSGMKTNIGTSVELQLLDKDGNVVNDSTIKKNIESVTIYAELLATADVPVTFKTMGVPAAGYRTTGIIESTPKTVKIAGKKSVIDGITAIEVPEDALNITGQSGNMTTIVNIKDYLPDLVSYAGSSSDAKMSVTVKIEEESTKELVIPAEKFTIVNVPDNMDAAYVNIQDQDQIIVQVVGIASAMDSLDESQISGTVDISKMMKKLGVDTLAAGTYNQEVEFNLPDGTQMVTPYNATITIQAKAE